VKRTGRGPATATASAAWVAAWSRHRGKSEGDETRRVHTVLWSSYINMLVVEVGAAVQRSGSSAKNQTRPVAVMGGPRQQQTWYDGATRLEPRQAELRFLAEQMGDGRGRWAWAMGVGDGRWALQRRWGRSWRGRWMFRGYRAAVPQ
jgi:hypothetical protein